MKITYLHDKKLTIIIESIGKRIEISCDNDPVSALKSEAKNKRNQANELMIEAGMIDLAVHQMRIDAGDY